MSSPGSSVKTTALQRSRNLARRALRRAERALGAELPPNRDLPPVQLSEVGSRVPLQLPNGCSREDVYALLSSLSIDNAPSGELGPYLSEDFERFLLTWNLVRDCRGTALEIGANPYFTTILLRTFTELETVLTNCFDPHLSGQFEQTIEYRDPRTTQFVSRTISYESLNVEAHSFPWPDESFDVVIFGEVIEHLTIDPVAALLEIHRVLKTDGTFVITTPNVARLENVARLVAGANLYDPYSGYGPFGRHNREFTRHELVRLLEFSGFAVNEHFTADVHPHRASSFVDPALLAPLLGGRLEDLGQYLFIRASKAEHPRSGRPSELYRSWPTDSLQSWG